MKRGQSTLDYIFLLGVVAAAIIAILVYIGRSMQGNLRARANQLSPVQYEPGQSTGNYQTKTLTSYRDSGSTSSTDYGDNSALNAKLKEIKEKQKEIDDKQKEIDTLNEVWETTSRDEAISGAASARGGNFNVPVPSDPFKQAQQDLADAYDELNTLAKEMKDLQDSLPDRAQSRFLGSSSFNRDGGGTIDNKHINETMGNL